MKVSLELPSDHADRVENALLTVHVVVLDDGMQKMILSRNVDLACLDGHLLDVSIVNLCIDRRGSEWRPAVEASNVTSCRGDEDAANLRIAVRLSVRQGIMHTLGCDCQIDNFAFAHASRGSESYPEDTKGAPRARSRPPPHRPLRCPLQPLRECLDGPLVPPCFWCWLLRDGRGRSNRNFRRRRRGSHKGYRRISFHHQVDRLEGPA